MKINRMRIKFEKQIKKIKIIDLKMKLKIN
jgi:hypothetical protein